MQQQNFNHTAFAIQPKAPFYVHGCDSLAVFMQACPGEFVPTPPGYLPADGFSTYRVRGSGEVIAIRE